jgi:hypothetical protein
VQAATASPIRSAVARFPAWSVSPISPRVAFGLVGYKTDGPVMIISTATRTPPATQTAVPHVSAVGDVIGFPALASTSPEQG